MRFADLGRRRAAALALLALGLVSTRADDEVLDDNALKWSDAAAEEAGRVGDRWVDLLHTTYAGDVSKLFDHYNRFTDGTTQALGNQECRALLKDLDVGPYALRGEYATAMIAAGDGDGDGKLSLPELSAMAGALGCWLWPNGERKTTDLLKQLTGWLEKDGDDSRGDVSAAFGVLEAHRDCPNLRRFYSRCVRGRVRKAAADLYEAVRAEAPADQAGCAASLVRAIRAATIGDGASGPGALRRFLSQRGVKPLLLRQAVAQALVGAADADSDARLSADELDSLVQPVCAVHAALGARVRPRPLTAHPPRGGPYASPLSILELHHPSHVQAASAIDVAEALAFGTYGIDSFTSDLDERAPSDAGHARARDVIGRGAPRTPAEAAEVARALVTLVPIAPDAPSPFVHDEL